MKILFLVNSARRDLEPDVELMEGFRTKLDDSGVEYRLESCTNSSDAKQKLDEAVKEGFDTIWIGGGDGSVHHTINLTFDKHLAYGIVPMGTVNALARALHLPEDPLDAVDYLLKASPVLMDVGKVDDRYFFAYATVGFHAALFHNVSNNLKKRWGILAFWVSAFRTVWQMSQLPRFKLRYKYADRPPPGKAHEASQAGVVGVDSGYSFLLSNMRNFAGFGIITPETPNTNGYLELHHFRHNKLLSLFKWFALLKFFNVKRSDRNSGRMHRWIQWCEISTNQRKLSVQVDGEPIELRNKFHARFEIQPDAVQILLQEKEAKAVGAVTRRDNMIPHTQKGIDT